MRRRTFVRFQQLLDTMFVDRRGRICSVSRHGQPNTEEGHSGRTWVLNCLNLQVIIIQIHTKGILVVHENWNAKTNRKSLILYIRKAFWFYTGTEILKLIGNPRSHTWSYMGVEILELAGNHNSNIRRAFWLYMGTEVLKLTGKHI